MKVSFSGFFVGPEPPGRCGKRPKGFVTDAISVLLAKAAASALIALEASFLSATTPKTAHP